MKDFNFIDRYNAIAGSIVAALTYILGEHWGLFSTFFLFNVLDWITGWVKSRLAGVENSQKGWTGVLKKVVYWIMILLGFQSARWFISIGEVIGVDLHITTLLGWFVLASLTVNELRSILENLVEAGFEVPEILIKGLEVANKTINGTEEK